MQDTVKATASTLRSVPLQLGCIAAVTGQEDVVSDGETTYVIGNGHALLTRVTGAGCLLSSVIGAFAAIAEPGRERLDSIAEALAFYGIAAEQAAERTAQQGPGSFQIELLNQLAQVTPALVTERSQIRQAAGGAR